METLQLTKHQALGNDFLIALLPDDEKTALDERRLDWPGLAKLVCDRRTDAGADGLILGVGPSSLMAEWSESAFEGSKSLSGSASVTMVLYNADGSRAEMSGNGSACLANALARTQEPWSHAFEQLQESSLRVEIKTAAGSRSVSWRNPVFDTEKDGQISLDTHVDVHMPRVAPGPEIGGALNDLITERFGTADRGTGDVGNPHLVIAAGSPVNADETANLGALYESHFADGINVEFIWPITEENSPTISCTGVGMSVWERGAGLTQACGTGAVVAATRAREWGLVKSDFFTDVAMPGGSVTVAHHVPSGALQLLLWVEHVADISWPLRGPWLDG